jgi:hypothetical protein
MRLRSHVSGGSSTFRGKVLRNIDLPRDDSLSSRAYVDGTDARKSGPMFGAHPSGRVFLTS